MSAKNASPRAATREAGSGRRAELLAIAGELFASRGFLATTVREIADAAGILSGSLYHHFDSKESMVDEILRDFLDHQRAINDEVLRAHPDARTAIAELIRQSFRAMHRYPHAVAIFQNESKYLAQFDRFEYLSRAAAEFERTWTRVLRDGQRAGAFRGDLNVKLAYRFIRDTVWTSVHWYNPRGRLTANVVAEQYVAIFCDGISEPDRA
ncbi:TetR/AcrR family transcriptional regulator [Saccharopolyspora cebuensis]|uniref:TetR/AcrR family transcriptional regulator n=1 Tax=Saccharopolyspora cebuensis TaxID=418759 RepID=A0ABV4CFL0_9PSEU